MVIRVANIGAVLDKLLAKTLERSLTWSDSNEPTEYVAESSKFFYYIKSRDEDGVAPYRFQIFSRSQTGVKLTEQLSVDQDDEVRPKFGQLHDLAGRSAAGLSRELGEEILLDLDDGPEPF